MDAMFYEVFTEEKEALKRHLPKNLSVGFSMDTVQAVPRKNPPARLVSIRTQSVIPVAWAKSLSGIVTRSSGFDHLSVFRRKAAGKIAYGYLPTYCERSVAEHAFLMILALARKLKQQIAQLKSFDRNGLTGMECSGRTLLVIGVGRIGSEVVGVAKGLGMRVKGVDLIRRLPSLEYVTLKQGLSTADVIVCALPLTSKTNGMLNHAVLRNVKKGAIFVNISRGEISPIRNLKKLLDAGKLAGIGLDVYEEESDFAECLRTRHGPLKGSGKKVFSLKEDDRVLLTPHNAFNTKEALERKAKRSVEAVIEFLKRGSFPNPVPVEKADAQ